MSSQKQAEFYRRQYLLTLDRLIRLNTAVIQVADSSDASQQRLLLEKLKDESTQVDAFVKWAKR